MTPILKQPQCSNTGFVVAMLARVTTGQRPSFYEWIIVSRWGSLGEHLAVGRTKVQGKLGVAAPIELTPRQTTVAELLPLPPASRAPTFLLRQYVPPTLSVAGDFIAAEGYLRLYGRNATLRIRAEGRDIEKGMVSEWRMNARRTSWIGEFIESATPRST